MATEKDPLGNIDFEGIYEEFMHSVAEGRPLRTREDDFRLEDVFDEISQAMAENRPIRTEIKLTQDQIKNKVEIEDNFINHNVYIKDVTADKLADAFHHWKMRNLSGASEQLEPIYKSITLSTLSQRAQFFEQGWSEIAQKSPPDSKEFLNAAYESKKFAIIHELLEMASIRKKIPNPRD